MSCANSACRRSHTTKLGLHGKNGILLLVPGPAICSSRTPRQARKRSRRRACHRTSSTIVGARRRPGFAALRRVSRGACPRATIHFRPSFHASGKLVFEPRLRAAKRPLGLSSGFTSFSLADEKHDIRRFPRACPSLLVGIAAARASSRRSFSVIHFFSLPPELSSCVRPRTPH